MRLRVNLGSLPGQMNLQVWSCLLINLRFAEGKVVFFAGIEGIISLLDILIPGDLCRKPRVPTNQAKTHLFGCGVFLLVFL